VRGGWGNLPHWSSSFSLGLLVFDLHNDADCIAETGTNQFVKGVSHRGGKQTLRERERRNEQGWRSEGRSEGDGGGSYSPALLWEPEQDGIEGVLKAHVKESVGLVEHQHLEILDIEVMGLGEEVEESARGDDANGAA